MPTDDVKLYTRVLDRVKVDTNASRLEVVHMMMANQLAADAHQALNETVLTLEAAMQQIDRFFNTPTGKAWRNAQ